jgi:diguanylate cyclase (GGDEF) domain
MKSLKASILTHIEKRPAISIIAIWALFIPIMIFTAYCIARSWEKAYVTEQITQEHESLSQTTHRVEEMAFFKFDIIKKYASLMTINNRITKSLLSTDNTEQTSAYLQRAGNVLNLQRVFILNSNGICIATSNQDEPDSLVGVDLSDRQYYQVAMTGKSYAQFIVGRVSSIPGFHISFPVYVGSEIMGVIVLKMDTDTLSQQLYLPTGFITDREGVVVLADSSSRMLKVVPGEPASQFDTQEYQQQYQRDYLEPVYLQEETIDGMQLWRLSPGGDLHIFEKFSISNIGLYIYSFTNVAKILQTGRDIFYRNFFILMAVFLISTAFIIGTITTLVRDKYMQISLQNANTQLQVLAQHDSLTGLLNRRMFDSTIATYFAQTSRLNTSFALVIFDIDYFKMLNDSFGHQEGDRVIREVTKAVRSTLVRATDSIFRIGGEEFAVLSLATSAQEVSTLMEHLRSVVENLAIPHPRQPDAIVTISLGGILISKNTETKISADEAFHKADDALYEAKTRGRNQAVLAQPEA